MQKKTTAKAESRKSKSNWLVHEAAINKGMEMELNGWLDAAVECGKWKSKEEYARESAKLTLSYTANTISQYCGTLLNGIRKYGSVEKLLVAYDKVYTERGISDMRKFLAGSGQRQETKKRKESTVSVTKRKVQSACSKAGLSSKQTALIMESFGF